MTMKQNHVCDASSHQPLELDQNHITTEGIKLHMSKEKKNDINLNPGVLVVEDIFESLSIKGTETETGTDDHHPNSPDDTSSKPPQQCEEEEHPKCNISNEKKNNGVLLNDILQNTEHIIPRYSIICDAWYGFPTQKKPRRERIRAVAKQLTNFLTWQLSHIPIHCTSHDTKLDTNSNTSTNANTNNTNTTNTNDMSQICNIYLVGKKQDVIAVREGMQNIHKDIGKHQDDSSTSTSTSTVIQYVKFLPDVTVESLCKHLSLYNHGIPRHDDTKADNGTIHIHNHHPKSTTQETKKNTRQEVVYLSPDADDILSSHQYPPVTVIVGMLVDRRVTQNRSKSRAEGLSSSSSLQDKETLIFSNTKLQPNNNNNSHVSLKCARLPLDALNTSDLHTDEPLNIDTVMEIVCRWWYNWDMAGKSDCRTKNYHACHNNTHDQNSMEEGCSCSSCCYNQRKKETYFVDAAARAMLHHRERHPNRTIHGNGRYR